MRFEGEYTIRDLAECIDAGREWKKIKSIAFSENGRIVQNSLRDLEKELDLLPYPCRSQLTEYAFGKKFATLLAGRGCLYDCSFCNLREFYLPFRGTPKRIRKPELVVKEMEYLFNEMNCSIFLFQDDDFPVRHKNNSLWIERFCEEIENSELNGNILWKINCRPDEIEERIFARMKNAGLFLVFIGIEDGTDAGLKRLNKHMTVNDCLKGIDTLKKLGIGFDYGFMLFQPSTTFVSLHENLDFLKTIIGDGYAPLTFLKMMPYYDTPLEKELISAGRIKGEAGYRDYDFPEENMNHYFEFITDCFPEWTRSRGGLANISKWARNYLAVCSHYFDMKTALPIISKDIRKVISGSNLFMIDTMKELATIFESAKYEENKSSELRRFKKRIRMNHEKYKRQINSAMITLVTLKEFQREPHCLLTSISPVSAV